MRLSRYQPRYAPALAKAFRASSGLDDVGRRGAEGRGGRTSANEDPRITRVLAGESVVANVGMGHPDAALVEWAKDRGLLVYIGHRGRWHRWPQTIWANPFHLGKHGDRDQVIAAYREHLEHSPALKMRLPELRGKVLGCWRHPLPCHGDVLLRCVNR